MSPHDLYYPPELRRTPIPLKELESHEQDYKANAWEAYSFQELGNFVHLLVKRAEHRANTDKRAKDLYDAQNYLSMMQSKLDALKS